MPLGVRHVVDLIELVAAIVAGGVARLDQQVLSAEAQLRIVGQREHVARAATCLHHQRHGVGVRVALAQHDVDHTVDVGDVDLAVVVEVGIAQLRLGLVAQAQHGVDDAIDIGDVNESVLVHVAGHKRVVRGTLWLRRSHEAHHGYRHDGNQML